MTVDYKDTLNLPQTDFKMKANLPVREPEFVKKWEENNLYQKIMEKNNSCSPFILHDGPPYANGHIHFGHILNKVLKDIVVKYRNMNGFKAGYIPGWDCHGMPIELHVEKELGKGKEEMPITKIREKCKKYALKFVDIQRDEFKRIGVLGDWDNPYLTVDHKYEASIVREFGKFVSAGSVYKGKKPVYWCASCKTALAEAEVEYMDHTSPSIYVKFALDDENVRTSLSPKGLPVYAVIWTTTPWTIPSNLAIALNPSYDYVLVKVKDELWLIVKELLDGMMQEIGVENYEVVREVDASSLEKVKFKHPLINRASIIILGDHVTMEAGSGCVHTAPGHGREDFEIGQKYKLPAFAPIDDRGCFTKEVGLPYLEGVFVQKANAIVNQKLEEAGALVWQGKVTHSYPHCWRCKQPIVFRSTSQWFISMAANDLQSKALNAIDTVTWIPKWGRDRIYGMIESRPDWCISRQRAWGVPIVAFKCKDCEEDILDAGLIAHVADIFEKEGAEVWFYKKTEDFITDDFKCPKCGGRNFDKENNIIDIWFESSVSFAAVIENSDEGHIPVDLYLEGSDQHRGWFHHSLLIGMANRGMPPFKSVLTHGFVVDAKGKKYSKSAGNYVPPEKILKASGAEILRLWVAAEDYRNDIRVSDEILKRLTDAYRKIRNTARFILGNINDFNPDKDKVEFAKMQEIDKWILHRLSLLVAKCRKAYEEYQFHVLYHAINEFCVVDLSSFYLDIIKDRLYCEKKEGALRRSAQSAMYLVLDSITKIMAPVLSFTAEDVWTFMPEFKDKAESVFLTNMPEKIEENVKEELAVRWDKFKIVRSAATKILEKARAEKIIGNSLEAKLIIEADDKLKAFLTTFGDALPDLFIVSQAEFENVAGDHVFESEDLEGLKIAVHKADGEKCERCWKYSETVGKNADHPTICVRCSGVVS